MNIFILVKNLNDQNTTMWDICTKNNKGQLSVWATIMDDAIYNAGSKEEVRNADCYLMDFTLTAHLLKNPK